jgi:transposase-like protein
VTEHPPRAGVHYPRSAGEFQSWFATDEDCLDYLAWLRWPKGFVCPRCEDLGGWVVADGSYKCASCKAQTAVTAGTLFDRRRTPLTVWFAACWQFATAKDGVSALALQRTLEIGSYQTAWAMLHRLRSVLVRPGRDRLTGTVEVDETYPFRPPTDLGFLPGNGGRGRRGTRPARAGSASRTRRLLIGQGGLVGSGDARRRALRWCSAASRRRRERASPARRAR